MANLYRLIFIILVLFPLTSHAQLYFNINLQDFTSLSAACNSVYTSYSNESGQATGTAPTFDPDTMAFNCHFQFPDGTSSNRIDGFAHGSCDAPAVFNNSTFQCDVPSPTCANKDGQVVASGDSDFPVTPQVGCQDGCEMLWNPTSTPFIDCAMGSGVGACYYKQSGSYKWTGATCSGTTNPATTAPKRPTGSCPACDCMEKGKSYGTVNGVIVCVTAGSPGSTPVTTPPASSSASTANTDSGGTTSTTTTNTTTSTTFNSDNTVTTINNVTTNTNGTPSTTAQSSTQPLDDYCASHPTVQQCKEAKKGTFGGACNSGFTCDSDDAVTCAIATEEYRRNCQLFDNQTTLSQLGQSLTDGTDPNASNDPTTHKTIVDLPTSLNEDSHFSGDLQDETVSLGQFGNFTLPFSKLNTILGYMGFIVLAFSYIGAVKIVGVS